MDDILQAIFFIVIILAVALTTYYSRKTQHIERMTLLEKGYADLSVLKNKKFPWRRLGLIAAGFGIGAPVGEYLSNTTALSSNPGLVGISSIALFIGLALIISSHLDKKDEMREMQQNGDSVVPLPSHSKPMEEKTEAHTE